MRHVILHPRIEDLLRCERNPTRLVACQLRISGHGDQPALYCIAPHHWVAQLRPYGSLEVVRVPLSLLYDNPSFLRRRAEQKEEWLRTIRILPGMESDVTEVLVSVPGAAPSQPTPVL